MAGRFSVSAWALVLYALAPVGVSAAEVALRDSVESTLPDDGITAAIERKIGRDATLGKNNIRVYTRDGYVNLEGSVSSFEAAKQAIALAENTPGVRGVYVRFQADD